ncbi:hypothetical protein [Mycobacterium sp.]|uniref:hypothetical protein n=1 Tax=Mycobacterium sp. TaxID=1785 RepID=UPI0031D72A26
MTTQPSSGIPSPIEAVIGGIKALAELSATGLADALGLYTAARAAISTVASGVAAASVEKTINEARSKYLATPLTPAVLADMQVRNLIHTDYAHSEAALSGLDGARMDLLTLDTGEAYGIDQALRLYNRGLSMTGLEPGPNYQTGTPLYVGGKSLATEYGITKGELDTVVHYSRVRDEFIPDLLKLARNTLSTADAVEMAVKQVVDHDTAAGLFEAAGGVREQFDAIVDAAGDAAGLEKAVELAAHGVITTGQLDQIVGMSRINPRFYYLTHPDSSGIAPLYRHWLGPFEISQAVRSGTVTPEVGAKWMAETGYDKDQAAAFTTGIATATLNKPKEETATMVLAEYEAGMLPATSTDPAKPGATEILESLGYLPKSIPFLLSTAMWRRVVASRNAAVTRVRASFLLYDMDSSQASKDLSRVGVPSETIPDLLTAWDVERSAPHEHLTVAQIGKLVKEGAMSLTAGKTRWSQMGYTATDVEWLGKIYPPPAPTVTYHPSAGPPEPATAEVGEPVKVVYKGMAPGGGLTVEVGGLVADLTAGGTVPPSGDGEVTFLVPAAPDGAHTVDLNDSSGGSTTATGELTVTGQATTTAPVVP